MKTHLQEMRLEKSMETKFLLYIGKLKKNWDKHFMDESGVNF